MSRKTTVIGYGSLIRGDDAAGLLLAEQLRDRRFPGLQVFATPQLYPELAREISDSDQVIFVDATVATKGEQDVLVRPIQENAIPPVFGHTFSPDRIVEMAQRLYGAKPTVWMVTIPGFEFDWKEGLSPATAAAMSRAKKAVLKLANVNPLRRTFAKAGA